MDAVGSVNKLYSYYQLDKTYYKVGLWEIFFEYAVN